MSKLLRPFQTGSMYGGFGFFDQTLIFSKIALITPQKFHSEASKSRFYV